MKKTLRKNTVFVFFFLLVAAISSADAQSNSTDVKSHDVDVALHSLSKVTAMAKNNLRHSDSSLLTKEQTQKLRAIVAQLRSVQQAQVLAQLCESVMNGQEAGDQPYDTVFENTYWFCVEKISGFPTAEAEAALERMSRDKHTGDLLTMRYYKEKQARLKARSRRAVAR